MNHRKIQATGDRSSSTPEAGASAPSRASAAKFAVDVLIVLVPAKLVGAIAVSNTAGTNPSSGFTERAATAGVATILITLIGLFVVGYRATGRRWRYLFNVAVAAWIAGIVINTLVRFPSFTPPSAISIVTSAAILILTMILGGGTGLLIAPTRHSKTGQGNRETVQASTASSEPHGAGQTNPPPVSSTQTFERASYSPAKTMKIVSKSNELELTEDSVIIRRRGASFAMASGINGDRSIAISSITATHMFELRYRLGYIGTMVEKGLSRNLARWDEIRADINIRLAPVKS